MTISPSSAQAEHNMKTRNTYCPNCKTYGESNQPNPICHDCGNIVLTVIRSMIDGQVVTGNDGLAQRTS